MTWQVSELATKGAIGLAVVTTAILSADKLKAVIAPLGPAYLSSAGGPFTIHPWPPMTKLMISGASMLELDRPTEKISLSQVRTSPNLTPHHITLRRSPSRRYAPHLT
jgi:hypothetical protein